MGKLPCKDPQIPVGVVHPLLPVADGNVTVHHPSDGNDHLMHRTLPPKAACPPEQPLPLIGEGRLPLCIKGNMVGHHDDIGIEQGLAGTELLLILCILRFLNIVPHFLLKFIVCILSKPFGC